ncbi:hypothetical protein [Roseisolibacter agri]|nr:hypothetical protein [Roseisolibacter agri]
MPESSTSSRRRTWADVVAIVAGVAAIGLAMWPNLAADEGPTGVALGSGTLASFAAGGLAIAAVFMAQRSPGTARIPLALGGVLLLLSPFVFARSAGVVPTLQMVLGALMLVAAPFIGRLPDEPSELARDDPRPRL